MDLSQMVVQGIYDKDPEAMQLRFFKYKASQFRKQIKYPTIRELAQKKELPKWIPIEEHEDILNEI